MELIAEETNSLILEAAEEEFARRGFAATRLEDIAERVGITRAAVIYHYGDKQRLYDAVLAATFKALTDRIEDRVGAAGSDSERIEAMIDAWIESSNERPTLARLFMREAADAFDGFRPEVDALVTPLFARIIGIIEAGQRNGAVRQVDPAHLVTILAGATTWYATSARLFQAGSQDTVTPEEHYLAYRSELIRITRLLLGTLPRDEVAEGHG
jgi:TetR/AcrR family transcriptional regulator